MEILEILGAFFLLGGSLFCIIGGIGIVRFPDFYSRCHGAGVTDSAGAAGILIGLMFVSEPLVAVKLLTTLAFLWITSVASTHALVKAAYARGVRVRDDAPLDWTHSTPPPPKENAREEE